jgi:hypothetical protein
MVHAGFLPVLFFDSQGGDNMFLRNVGWLSNGLHGVISQEIEVFIATAVRTPDPTTVALINTFLDWYTSNDIFP